MSGSSRLIRICLGLALVSGCDKPRSSPPVEQPDSARNEGVDLDARLADLDDSERRSSALAELRRLAFEVDERGDAAEIEQLADALLPVLAERWSSAAADERRVALTIALYLATPDADPLWAEAIEGGNPEEVRLALDGVARAGTWGSAVAMLGRLQAELTALDVEDEAGLRMVRQLIDALGDARDGEAVAALIQLLEGPELPRSLQRSAISALGRIGDPRAVDTLIAVQFRIPDTPSTQSIGERSLRALGAIGEAALPAVLATFVGNNRRVNALAEEAGLPPEIVSYSMIRLLGVIGSKRATDPLLDRFPRAGCAGTPAPGDEVERAKHQTARSYYANALGYIADPAAVETLCSCIDTTNPTELWEIAAALGRIGGDAAADCLATILTEGHYEATSVEAGMELEIRWKAFRWAAIATPPARRSALAQLLEAMPADVRAEVEGGQLALGLELLETCASDMACYAEVLADPERHPFERERAAFELARGASPGDVELAATIAAGFATFDPEVRINMAWLAGKVAGGWACPDCVEALEGVMRDEDSTKTAQMQGAWIMARQTVDKAHAGRR